MSDNPGPAKPKSKKPDLVKQQLERIRKIRPKSKSAGNSTSTEDPTRAFGDEERATEVNEYVNRDAAARPDAPRDPVVLGAAVDSLIEANDWSKQAELATVMADWNQLIGDNFAQHVQPIGFEADRSILILQADSTAWATQTRVMAIEILKKIDDTVGSGVVASLEVKGPEPVRKARGRYRVKGRGPRDTYG